MSASIDEDDVIEKELKQLELPLGCLNAFSAAPLHHLYEPDTRLGAHPLDDRISVPPASSRLEFALPCDDRSSSCMQADSTLELAGYMPATQPGQVRNSSFLFALLSLQGN